MAGIVVINISLEGDNEVSEIYKLHRQTRWVDLEAMVRGNGTWASFTVKSLDCVILAYLIKWNSISDMYFWKLFNCHKRSCVLSCKIGSCFEQNKDKTKWRPLFTSNISRKFITKFHQIIKFNESWFDMMLKLNLWHIIRNAITSIRLRNISPLISLMLDYVKYKNSWISMEL